MTIFHPQGRLVCVDDETEFTLIAGVGVPSGRYKVRGTRPGWLQEGLERGRETLLPIRLFAESAVCEPSLDTRSLIFIRDNIRLEAPQKGILLICVVDGVPRGQSMVWPVISPRPPERMGTWRAFAV